MEEKTFNKDIREIIRISKEYDAEKVLLFGSCLEEIESANDIDIAVEGVDPLFGDQDTPHKIDTCA